MDNVSVMSPELPTVCPFRTQTRMIPNQYNAVDQVMLYPECMGNACPFFNVDAESNADRCFRAMKEAATIM